MPYFGNCNPVCTRWQNQGYQSYYLQGCRKMQVHYNQELGDLRIKGSLPYFLNGHNFTFSTSEYIESINLIQSLLHIDLWDARIKEVEHGVIFPVNCMPSLIIKNHAANKKAKLIEEFKGRDKGRCKWWNGKNIRIKMYDAKHNIEKKQELKAREIIKECGFDENKEYLKFEIHLEDVPKLRMGKGLSVEDLQNPDIISFLDRILKNQYKLLEPMKEVVLPNNKSEYTALNIVLSQLVKLQMEKGISIYGTQKGLYEIINNSECLSKTDKDSRKSTIRKAFARLNKEEESKWDVSKKIDIALQER